MNNPVVQENDLRLFQVIAQSAAKSGLYKNAGGVDAIFMVLLAAHDLGIKPTIALNGGIWNIKGKIEISARLMTSMVRRAGHSLNIKESTATSCTILGKRCDNADEHEITFTIQQAKTAGLVRCNHDGSPGMWQKYPEDMLYARALSRLARRLFPDVIGTAYVEGEIRDAPPMQEADCEVSDCAPEEPKDEIQQISVHPTLAKMMVNAPNEDKSPQIDHELARQLLNLSKKCDPDYVKKVMAYLVTKGIENFINLTEKEYKKVKIGLEKNYELVKSAQV